MLNLKIGINLGDALDCCVNGNFENELDIESAWTGCKITEQNIDAVKAAGFNAVRIPVSWHDHISDKDNYTISKPWLDRVNEVVDWCIERGLYVILNIHHDGGEKFYFPSEAHLENTLKYVTSIWKQLSERFKNYDEKLIFNSVNEPRLFGHECEWRVDTKNPDVVESIKCINKINQAFVDTVRSSGGKNKTRYLLCPGYDASPDGVLNDYFKIPDDPENDDNRIMVSVHAYVPFHFALDENGVSEWSRENPDDTEAVEGFMDKLHDKYVSKGIPVIIDEFGARNKNDNIAERIDWVSFYVVSAKKRGIACFWWDNNRFKQGEELFGLLDRKTSEWKNLQIVQSMISNTLE